MSLFLASAAHLLHLQWPGPLVRAMLAWSARHLPDSASPLRIVFLLPVQICSAGVWMTGIGGFCY